MVEDGLVDLGISHQGGARRHRFRASRLTGDERHGRCGMCGDQVNLAIDQLGLRGCQPQQPLQFIEKTPLTLDQSAICLTNAQGHFVSQLALSGIHQLGGCRSQGQSLEQHVLIETGEIRCRAKARVSMYGESI